MSDQHHLYQKSMILSLLSLESSRSLQPLQEENSKTKDMPAWKRKLVEAKEAKKIAKESPALAVALKSKELAEQEARERGEDM